MNISSRTNWHRQLNKLAESLESRRSQGKVIYDLTNANPTECGITYPEQEILSAIASPQVLHYRPEPRGLLPARQAVAGYYGDKNILVDASRILLTASTSEAYSLIFKLLCNPQEAVLVPVPSYPLFEYLAQTNDVRLQQYRLMFDHEWTIDIDSMRNAINSSTKAIVIIHPHNPTGMFLKKETFQHILELATEHDLALVVDEVFIEYAFEDDTRRCGSTAGISDVLTFTLNGISKLCGLPQMKLGWLIVGGNSSLVTESVERLEILCDIFLSVNTQVQVALPELLNNCKTVRDQIRDRVKSNYAFLHNSVSNTPCSTLSAEGGWYGILRLPKTKTDEEWAIDLLDHHGIYTYPGHFFDLEEGYLVVSLLAEERPFRDGLTTMVRYVSSSMNS